MSLNSDRYNLQSFPSLPRSSFPSSVPEKESVKLVMIEMLTTQIRNIFGKSTISNLPITLSSFSTFKLQVAVVVKIRKIAKEIMIFIFPRLRIMLVLESARIYQ